MNEKLPRKWILDNILFLTIMMPKKPHTLPQERKSYENVKRKKNVYESEGKKQLVEILFGFGFLILFNGHLVGISFLVEHLFCWTFIFLFEIH